MTKHFNRTSSRFALLQKTILDWFQIKMAKSNITFNWNWSWREEKKKNKSVRSCFYFTLFNGGKNNRMPQIRVHFFLWSFQATKKMECSLFFSQKKLDWRIIFGKAFYEFHQFRIVWNGIGSYCKVLWTRCVFVCVRIIAKFWFNQRHYWCKW